MKKEYTLTRKDGTTATFERKKDFERAARLEAQRGATPTKKQQAQAEDRRYRHKREAHRNACAAIVQLAQDVDTSGAKNYRFAPIYEHCAPNGWLTCKVPFNTVLNPDPNQKDFASMLGVGLVECILFDIMDDAVAFKHFKGYWFTVGVSCGVGEQVTIPKSLGEQLDALCAKKE